MPAQGGKSRTVGIDCFAAAERQCWMEPRAARGLDERAPLFCSRTGGPVRAAYIRRLLAGLAARAGIFKRVHAHGLRHTHASELRAEGLDIAIISRQLGHVSIATTARYLDHIAAASVIKAMQGRAWVA